jgi:hypothetical protein
MEQQKGESFDWNKFLKNAIRRKTPMDMEEHYKAIDRSKSWVTCACGNQCSIIPRDSVGAPIDNDLADLGKQFFWDIKNENWTKAKNTLRQIEIKSIQLIQEEANKSMQILSDLGYKVSKN